MPSYEVIREGTPQPVKSVVITLNRQEVTALTRSSWARESNAFPKGSAGDVVCQIVSYLRSQGL